MKGGKAKGKEGNHIPHFISHCWQQECSSWDEPAGRAGKVSWGSGVPLCSAPALLPNVKNEPRTAGCSSPAARDPQWLWMEDSVDVGVPVGVAVGVDVHVIVDGRLCGCGCGCE